MAGPETRIVASIKKELKARGAFTFKVHGNEHMMAGLPDLVVCYRGLFIGFEVKTPVGVVSAVQEYVHKQIRSPGADGIVEVVTSAAEAVAVLNAVDGYIAWIHRATAPIRGRLDIRRDRKKKATPKGGGNSGN